MPVRNIVRIDEEKCNGCGLCVIPCAEGAIEIIDGKAKIMREELCDGAGFCLGVCPTGALTVEEREAPAFSDEAVKEATEGKERSYMVQKCFSCDSGEDQVTLFPCRLEGESLWVCARCLPRLIHG